MKILIADDKEDVRRALELVLRRSGFETISVPNGRTALEVAKETDLDLAVIDVFMPDMSGIEVCKRLKEEEDHFLPVILITGMDSTDTKVSGFDVGADDYVVKPFDNRELIARVKALCRLKTLHDEVRQLASIREQIVYTTSHDFRTPLVGIRGALQNLLSGLVGELTKEQREYLELVDEAAARLGDLTDEMNRAARRTRVDQSITLESVDLAAAAERAAAGFKPAIMKRGIKFEIDVAADCPPARADREKVTQVIANLLDNAIKHSPEGGLIRVEVKRSTEKGRVGAQVSVIDQGPGIARSDFERIFFRFEQVGAPEQTTSQGTGLGLAICKEIVDAHGGRIWVESEKGSGARFHVVLPAVTEKRGAA